MDGPAWSWQELAERAWGLIANASGGDWTKESPTWRRAAEAWRNEYHAAQAAAKLPDATPEQPK